MLTTYEATLQQDIDLVGRLRSEIEGLFHVTEVRTTERGDAVIFTGRLAQRADTVYDQLRPRFRRLGYTPLLRRERDADVVVAQHGLIAAGTFNPLINLLLLLATIFTTLLAGAGIAGEPVFAVLRQAWTRGDWLLVVPLLAAGLRFASSLLFILGVHEMGHYVAGRLHGVAVTLPYFIPVPFGLGTFGAFIQMKSPVENRRALFDVGLAGPLAGLVAAVALMVVGLMESTVVPLDGRPRLGTSLLLRWLVETVVHHAPDQLVQPSPVAIAAWFGLLVTGFNLLPIGQLDGGHIAYAVFGRWARPLALATFVVLLVLGYTVWRGWYTWAFFALITGVKHPAPLDDISALGWGRRLLGVVSLGLCLVLLTPRPW